MAAAPDIPSPTTLQILERLIAFDTVSERANLELIEHVAGMLDGRGWRVAIDRDDTGSKANIIASCGPDVPGGLMLAGHTDVVPVANQVWTHDPFKATRSGERIYGRGTCDMKGFIACALAQMQAVDTGALACPLYLAFTYDEETGCFGAQSLAGILKGMPVKPAYCVVGEPTAMSIVIGHKGKLSLDCTVRGTAGHSAYNIRHVNAVEIAAEVIAFLRRLQARISEHGPFDHRFDPAHTTIHTGVVHGGTARNIVPGVCRFELEIRNLPGQDAEAVLTALRRFADESLIPEMHAVASDSGIDLHVQSNIPALLGSPESAWTSRLLEISGDNAPRFVSFATEGGLYQSAGIETVICGPGRIEQAHKADEYVELRQLAACEAFLRQIVDEKLARPPQTA